MSLSQKRNNKRFTPLEVPITNKRNAKLLTGFMLLEVILSVLIIASGLLFIIQSYSTSVRVTKVARGLQKACVLLEEKLFDLDIKGDIQEGETSGGFEGEENYSWYLTAKHLGDKEELNKVDLSVAYGAGRQSRKIKISTFLRNRKG